MIPTALPIRTSRTWPCLLLGLCISASTSGCDDDDRSVIDPGPGEQRTGTLLGSLVRGEDGGAIGLLEVSLFDLGSFRPVALTRADSTGAFGFADLAPGDYLPVVHASDRALFGLPRARFRFTAGETLRVVLPLVPRGEPQDSTVELRGRVLDAQTDDPIALARVEMSAFEPGLNWSEFRGNTTQLEPLTDDDGRFRLVAIQTGLRFDENTGGFVEMVPSWRVTAPGYRALSVDGVELADLRTEVVVRLEPGSDAGVITGRVVDVDGNARVGVRVHAEWRAESGQVFKAGSFGRLIPNEASAVSDSAGHFRFEGLPGGRFNVLAGALADDGWVGVMKTGVEIEGDSLLARAGAIIAQPALGILEPTDGEHVTGSLTLRWEPVPGAVAYIVTLRRAVDLGLARFTVEGPIAEISPGSPPFDLPSLMRWEILALDAQGRQIAATDRPHLFGYVPRSRGCNSGARCSVFRR